MMQRFLASFLMLVLMNNLVVLAKDKGSSKSSLTVNIYGMKSKTGQVCLSLFSSSRGFPNDGGRALAARCINLEAATTAVTFDNLSSGSYAVAAFHDFNNDGIFNLNRLGIPKEGFGFSRNPRIFVGPPKFEDAVVVIVRPRNNIQIKLQYL